MAAPRDRLSPEQSVLLVVDIQEKFRDRVFNWSGLVDNARKLISGALLLDVPVVITEQYPQGLGETIGELQSLCPPSLSRYSKTTFGALADPGIEQAMLALRRPQVIVCGLETHVCIHQTLQGALFKGLSPFLVGDAVTSRLDSNRDLGIAHARDMGVPVVSTEMVLFEWLQDARHPQFKAVQQVILA